MAQMTPELIAQATLAYNEYMRSKTYEHEHYDFNAFETAVCEAISVSIARNTFAYVRYIPTLGGYFLGLGNLGDSVAAFYKGKDRTQMLQNHKLVVDKRTKAVYNIITR